MARYVSASDESTGKNQRDTFLFAGWVAPAEDWSRFFEPAWRERVLEGPPKIPYLHMTEMRSSEWRNQFGISRMEADHRIDEAISVIDTMGSLYPVGIYVDAGHVRDKFTETKVVAKSGASKIFDPDYICFLGYAYVVLSYMKVEHPDVDKVDFVVEKKGHITKYIQEFHSTLSQALEAIGASSLSSIVGELIPGEKDLIPLQAADVLCWHSARSQRRETMDIDDERRYFKIAHRKGSRSTLTNDQISQMATALLPQR